MAISTLLLRPFPPVTLQNPHKITKPPKIFPVIKSSKTNTHEISHKSSWKQELKKAFPHEISPKSKNKRKDIDHQIDENDQVLGELIDKRCVDNVRMLILDSVNHAKAGHPGMALGMAEVGYMLYRHVMRYNPRNPKWFNRDRFVLSAGHGCLLHYICLHLAGFQSVQVRTYLLFLVTDNLD